MNSTTQGVIEFLTHPELPFGTDEDLLLLSDPDSLRAHVASLLQDNPTVIGQQESENLKSHLDQADWALIVQEFKARVDLAKNFFDRDATSEREST